MHQLVTADNVKKMYRRAVLSVHPDKVNVCSVNFFKNFVKSIFQQKNDYHAKLIIW